jgi:hypothetical protein
VCDALRAEGATISGDDPVAIDLSELPRALLDVLGTGEKADLRARFDLPVGEGVEYLSRTHPIVDALASYVADAALDAHLHGIAKRAGVVRTAAVNRRTTILLVRFRFDITTRREDDEQRQLAEETRLLAFAGAPEEAEWLDDDAATALLPAEPDDNVAHEQARDLVSGVVEGYEQLLPHVQQVASERAEALLDAHRRVREGARLKGVRYDVEPQLPADVLGIYVLIPPTAS